MLVGNPIYFNILSKMSMSCTLILPIHWTGFNDTFFIYPTVKRWYRRRVLVTGKGTIPVLLLIMIEVIMIYDIDNSLRINGSDTIHNEYPYLFCKQVVWGNYSFGKVSSTLIFSFTIIWNFPLCCLPFFFRELYP